MHKVLRYVVVLGCSVFWTYVTNNYLIPNVEAYK